MHHLLSGAARITSFAILAATTCLGATEYYQVNLVSNIPGLATFTDPNLVNPWGISSSGTSPFWVSNAGTSTSTLYNSSGTPQALKVTIPGPGGFSGPTGQVFNATGDFSLSVGGSARFLFSTLTGTIAGWNPTVGTTAEIAFSNPGAVYTGLAQGAGAGENFLYAADFAGGKIDVLNGSFATTTLAGGFVDPALPAGYSPYNIQNIGGELFVMYAFVDTGTGRATRGAGLGVVSVFDTNGQFLRRFTTDGPLNAPWGITAAPGTGFGDFSGAILIGNFGDGTIYAFDPANGNPLGALAGTGGAPLVNEGLWGLRFGNGGNGGVPTSLYFAAGINNEADGLFGSIQAVPEPGTVTLFGIACLGLMARLRTRRN
jgi:uncharacterized protein (TIGR03118 family)